MTKILISIRCFVKNISIRTKLSLLCGIIIAGLLLFFGIVHGSSYENSIYNAQVSAFTTGRIFRTNSIFVEFVNDVQSAQQGEVVDKDIFFIKPALKGKAYWKDSRTIEFIPNVEDIFGEKEYQGIVNIGRLIPNIPHQEQTFVFSFSFFPLHAFIKWQNLEPLAENSERWNRQHGVIEFSEVMRKELHNIENILRVESHKKSNYSVHLERIDETSFRFVIDSVERVSEDYSLSAELVMPNLKLGSKIQSDKTIYRIDYFDFGSIEMVGDNILRVGFYSTLDPDQSIVGLIGLSNISSFSLNKGKNYVDIVFDNPANVEDAELWVSANVRSMVGKNLGTDRKLSVSVMEKTPQIQILNNGTILPASRQAILPFKAVNLKAVDVRVVKIYTDNILHFLQNNSLNGSSGLQYVGKLVMWKKVLLPQPKEDNYKAWQEYQLDLSGITKNDPNAIYSVEFMIQPSYSTYGCSGGNLEDFKYAYEQDEEFWNGEAYYTTPYIKEWEKYDWQQRNNPCHISYYMEGKSNVKTNILMSDIGIIAKKANGENKYFITLTDLCTTKPISNGEVEFFSFQKQLLGKTTTDANGFAELTLPEKVFVIRARHEKQQNYLKLNTEGALSLSKFDVSGKNIQKGLKGFIYGERGVWRPGDTIPLFFILEDKANVLPTNHPVTLTVTTSTGQLAHRAVSSTQVNGIYFFAIPTLPEAVTGTWQASISVGKTTFTKSLRVETIKPNRLSVFLQSSDSIIGKEEIITLSTKFLHGIIGANLRTTVDISLQSYNPRFKGYENYDFRNIAEPIKFSGTQIFDGKTDANGSAVVKLSSVHPEPKYGLLRAKLLTRVFEQGGDFSTISQSFTYSSAESYVGIQIPKPVKGKSYLETDKKYSFKIATVTAQGNSTSRKNLELRIYKVNWYWWWERENSDNLSAYINSSSHKPLYTAKLSTQQGKGSYEFSLPYPEWGRYLVYVVDRDCGSVASQTFYVDWGDDRNRADRENPGGLSMLTFSTDKKSYNVGEDIVINFPAITNGKILLSIENGSTVISREWIQISKDKILSHRIKTTPEYLPNIYLHATLIQEYGDATNDLPMRLYGITPIEIKDPTTILDPIVKLPEVIRPKKPFTVSVSEKTGKKNMAYTLTIVDEGLLSLTNFSTPRPWTEFYARESLGVNTWDIYSDVMGFRCGTYAQLLSVGGSDELEQEKSNNDKKMSRFKPVVKVVGPFVVKKGQVNKHEFTIDNYVGSVRAMVVGRAETAYGSTQTTAPVKNPLMILTSLPRVMSINETVQVPVNVFVGEKGIKDVEVTLSTKGLAKTVQEKVVLRFEEIGEKMAYFMLKVGEKMGAEHISITAKSGNHTATESIDILIRNPNPQVINSRIQTCKKNKTVKFEYKRQSHIQNNEEWAKMEIARIPLIDLSRQLNYLMAYPHGCSEQITSSAFPQLYLQNFVNLTNEQTQKIAEHVGLVINRLYGRQVSDGGITDWEGNLDANEWITSYAGHFLLEAKKAGFSVSDMFLAKWHKYQNSKATSWRLETPQKQRYYHNQNCFNQAYRLYTLALSGFPNLGAMNRMKEQQDKLSIQACWRLAATYALAGKLKIARNLVSNLTTKISDYSPYNETYGSSQRDMAMIVETLLLLDQTEQAFPLLQQLSENLSKGMDYNTQSIAYGLLAAAQVVSKSNAISMQGKLSINGKNKAFESGSAPVVQIDLPIEKSNTVEFTNNGAKDVFVTLTHFYRPKTDTAKAIQKGLIMDVSYWETDGRDISIEKLAVGKIVECVVKISNPSPHKITDLALTQIFPAGWEMVNERLHGTKQENQDLNFMDIRDDRIYSYFNLAAGETKTIKAKFIATYAGTYFLPAVYCEAMYNSKVFARGSGIWVKVER